MEESWINWRDKRIEIPAHTDCSLGRGGNTCGSCRQKAKQRLEHAPDDADVTLEDALATYWRPKTEAAVRGVYYGHSPRAEIVLEEFFEQWDAWPVSVQGVARRVERAASNADGVDGEKLSPHPLRATAATRLAGKGLEMSSLMQFFGWADSRVAMKYIKTSPEATARQLQAAHSR